MAGASAVKGDVIQLGNSDTDRPLHTAIVISSLGAGRFDVVDSNWNLDEVVSRHPWSPPATARYWRLGTLAQAPATPPPPRIGAVLSDESFSAKEGALDAPWVLEQGAVKQALLTATRIGAVLTDGSLYVKEGSLSAGWVLEAIGVSQAALAGNRIGYTTGTDNRLYVKAAHSTRRG